MMNLTFNARRMWQFAQTRVLESRRTMLMRLAMMTIVTCIMFIIVCYSQYPTSIPNADYLEYDCAWANLLVVIMVVLFCFGSISASLVFENMKRKESRISTLMVPATQIEKYAAGVLVYVVGILVLFCCSVFVADMVRLLIMPHLVVNPETVCMEPLYKLFSYDFNNDDTYLIVGNVTVLCWSLRVFLVVESFFVLGSAVWPKNSFIKTACALAAIGFVYSVLIGSFGSMVSEYMNNGKSGYYYGGKLDETALSHLFYILFTVMIVINYVVTYFRFKESEVIQRW